MGGNQIILMTDFDSKYFRMIKPTFQMLCNEIGLLVSPLIQITPIFLLYKKKTK